MGVRDSEVYFWISLASAVDTVEQQEECSLNDLRIVDESPAGWRAEALWSSSIWAEKKHVYVYREDRLEHWIELRGEGRIADLTFLSGTIDGAERGSIPGFGAVYVACPNFLDKPYSHPSEYTAISAGNVTELWGSALNCGPLMFAFGEFEQAGWLAAGLFVQPGKYGFQTMAFNKLRRGAQGARDHIVGAQSITLDYLGKEKVNGSWSSPKLVFFAAESPLSCVRRYCADLRRARLVPQTPAKQYDWWFRPIFCTWHEQVAQGQLELAGVPDGWEPASAAAACRAQCTQANTDRWVKTLLQHGISIGTIIVDDGWQESMSTNVVDSARFPDLRGFVEANHREGRRIVLWMRARETGGLPIEWCVRRNGEPVFPDPTHPAYRDYLAEMMRRMLGDGSDGYNADGLKVDGLNTHPGGHGLQCHGDVYGIELLRAYVKLVYDAAVAVKNDAMVTLYSANPYFADCCNVVRLGDLYTVRGDPRHTIRWRAETIRAAMPRVVIDTDGAFRFSARDDLAELAELQATVGVPCLYQAEHLVQHRSFGPARVRKLTDADYEALRRTMEKYLGRLRAPGALLKEPSP